MNIRKENTDELNMVLTVKIEQKDYEERVNNILNDYRKKAKLDGFRPGKVPQGLINKMYRKPVLAEEVNKILGESVRNFFTEEKLMIIGEPLPHLDDSPEIDWDHDRDFEFSYDIGLAPEVDLTLSNKDKITFYKIKIDDELRNRHIDQLRSRYGSLMEKEDISGDEMIRADLTETDSDGRDVNEGCHVEDVSIHLKFVKDEQEKVKFNGRRKGDNLIVNVRKAFPNEVDLAALLKVDKDRLKTLGENFRLTIRTISYFEKAAVNQDLFDKLYGKDAIHTEAEFNARVDEELASSFDRESMYRFRQDARDYLLKKFRNEIPDEFYKRWLIEVSDGKLTREELEKDYEKYTADLKWQLIKGKISREHRLEASEEELLKQVVDFYRMQFMQYYGMAGIPEETLEKYAKESLKKDEERKRFTEVVIETKVYELIRSTVKLAIKEVTLDEFNKGSKIKAS